MGRSRGKTPLVEWLVADSVMKPILTGLLGRQWVDEGFDATLTRAYTLRESSGSRGEARARQQAYLDNYIAFWHGMGYDFVRFERGMGFANIQMAIPDTAIGSQGTRHWFDEHQGMVRTWDDFERYPWPRIDEVDFFPFEYITQHLPEGMGLIPSHAGGVFEYTSWIMSLEGLSLALYDDPVLVQAVSDRVGELLASFLAHLLDLDNVAAVFVGDDMGFRNGPLISPHGLRRYALPWHRRLAAMAHQHGVPYFLHSCGRISAIMEDLIEDVAIDGKHSFEDTIMPIHEFQEVYGDRIAVLGGVDVHRLATHSPDEIRRHTRHLMDTCGQHGRFAIGSGNSIPTYVPVENYLAMLDEALS
jgi:uroporphyrinogen decarboxylase